MVVFRNCTLIALSALLLISLAGCPDDDKGPADFDLTLFHLNDRHSHWQGSLNCDYTGTAGDGTEGGAARWMTLVKDARASGDVLLLDAGDFTMGTMLVTAENNAGDLNMMQDLGFDAATLGNHELDWGPQGLASMIAAADKPMVPLLASNINFAPDDPADDGLEALYGPAGEAGKYIHPYIVLERPSGIKVGLLGLIGPDAESVSNARPTSFSVTLDQMIERTQELVNTLRNDEGVDLVIVLAHAGMTGDGSGGWENETVELAQQVEGIDAILSGHHHTQVPEGVEVACTVAGSTWTTVVMESGKYGRSVGKWSLARAAGVKTISSELITIDDSMATDADTEAAVAALVANVEQTVLSGYPQVPDAGAFLTGTLDQVLTCSDFDMVRHYYENNNLGYLLADAVAEATGVEFVGISNGGDLRESLIRCGDGCFDLSDAFITAPLGTGPDFEIGYPLVTFYLKWRELKLIMESTIADQGWTNNDFMLNLSGLRVQVDSSQIPFSRITRIEQYNPLDESDAGTLLFQKGDPNSGWHIEQDQLIHTAVSLYIGTFLASFNLVPKDANGDPVLDGQGNIDWPSMVVSDANGAELKLWYVLASKLASFDAAGMPAQYDDDVANNPFGPYWRRMCDENPGAENVSGNVCP